MFTKFVCWLIGWKKVEAAIREAFMQKDYVDVA